MGYTRGQAERISERKRAQGVWCEGERPFRTAFEHSNDAMFIVDPPADRIIGANPKACEMLEYTREELYQTPVSTIHPNEMSRLLTFAERVQGYGVGWSNELSCRTRTGKRVPVELSASIIEFGSAMSLLVIARDLTEHRLTEAALRNALNEVHQLKNRIELENIHLRGEIKAHHNFEEIIGNSEVLRATLRKVEQVAHTNATVMILGETGTGKELFARAIHSMSKRQDRPLVKVNCAALPANLVESELFGHEKGAFTGALNFKMGRFELADRGTIFLDEIGDLPLELQVKLLRILQDGEFERLGNSSTKKVDVRVIAATNRDLEKAVAAREFREDLYYRLNVFPLQAPLLRRRIDDIPLLVHHFVNKYAAKVGKTIVEVPQKIMDTLQKYDWPGNVRELENLIERAVILTSGSTLIVDEEFHPHSNVLANNERPQTLKEVELSLIRYALKDSNWVIEGKHGAAARLDIPPSTLRERMQKNGIERPHR